MLTVSYMHIYMFDDLQENFVTGNQVQLVSKSSGRCLQIVQSQTGQLVVDGTGNFGPQFFNGKFKKNA